MCALWQRAVASTFRAGIGWKRGRALCDDQEVVDVPPGRTVQRVHDACRVVAGALDEEGIAIAPEADRAGAGPRPEMSGCLPEAGGGFEAETACELDGSEHQLTRQLCRCFQRRGAHGGEETGRVAGAGADAPRSPESGVTA